MAHSMLRAAMLAGASLSLMPVCMTGFLPAYAQEKAPDLVITPNKQSQSIQEVGSSVTVVTQQEIAEQGFKSVRDALDGQPGLSIAESGGPGGLTSSFLRGVDGAHTLVLVDGMRINDPTTPGGETDLSIVPPQLIDRIEIVRGPQSGVYGSDAIGGVINIITKRPRKGPPVWQFRAEGGSYGTVGSSLSVSGATEDTTYVFALGQYHSDGFQRYGYRVPRLASLNPNGVDPFDRLSGTAKITKRVNDWLTIEAGIDITRSRLQFDYTYAPDPLAANHGRALLATAYQRAIAENGPFRTTLTTFQTRITRADDYADLSNDTYAGTRVGAEVQEDVKLDRYGSLTVGTRYERERATGEYVSGSYIAPFAGRQSTASAYALYQVTVFEKLHLSAAGRFDHVSTSGSFGTYRLTAAYDLTTTTRVKGSFGTGAKAPSLYQLTVPLYGNAALRAETSTGFDVGVEQTFLDGDARATVSYFNNKIDNLIDCIGGFPCSYVNVQSAKTSGVEVSAEYNVVPTFMKLKAAYTFLIAKDESTGLDLLRRPKHSGRISVAFTPTRELTIEPIVRLVGKRTDAFFNDVTFTTDRVPLKAYARFDLVADYKLNRNVSVFARGENLTNVKYEDIYNYGTAGRSIYAGVQMTW